MTRLFAALAERFRPIPDTPGWETAEGQAVLADALTAQPRHADPRTATTPDDYRPRHAAE